MAKICLLILYKSPQDPPQRSIVKCKPLNGDGAVVELVILADLDPSGLLQEGKFISDHVTSHEKISVKNKKEWMAMDDRSKQDVFSDKVVYVQGAIVNEDIKPGMVKCQNYVNMNATISTTGNVFFFFFVCVIRFLTVCIKTYAHLKRDTRHLCLCLRLALGKRIVCLVTVPTWS